MKLPPLAYNWLSLAGAMIAGLTTLLLLILLGLSFAGEFQNPYLGIFIYMVLPPILVVGLLLIPLGMWRRWRQVRRGEKIEGLRWPKLDLNDRRQRNAFLIFVLGTLAFLLISSVGTYQAYHFSESVEFCGTTCHVMDPEYTTYLNSPHARVACTSCHVGPGAGWYTRSKLSGLRQVYAVIANTYPRPIPTPIEDLRPAQDTCENCHWPRAFFGARQRRYEHYLYNEQNSRWPIEMLIKVGGGDPRTGEVAGIHWHMNIGVVVEYIARDERRQEIPWMRVTNRLTGRSTVYQSTQNPLSEEEVRAATPRVMDCMDCHNRPSHIFDSPDEAIDLALSTGRIDPSLPGIKALAVEQMAKEYASTEEALASISSEMTAHYREAEPELYTQRRALIENAILATQLAYSQNIFPAMRARWSAYPTNTGHFYDLGCFRCHEGEHRSEQGQVVTAACNACHVILAQGAGERAQVTTSLGVGLEFEHPVDIGDAWKDSGCNGCHTGVQP